MKLYRPLVILSGPIISLQQITTNRGLEKNSRTVSKKFSASFLELKILLLCSEYILNLCYPHTARYQVLVVNKSINTNDALTGFHQLLVCYIGTSTQHFGSNVSIMFVCQVETVGQVYMAVSGAPEYTPEHAENVADVAFCLLRQVKQFKLPSGISIQIRIGEILRLRSPLNRPLSLI
jgi:hypothetical protein